MFCALAHNYVSGVRGGSFAGQHTCRKCDPCSTKSCWFCDLVLKFYGVILTGNPFDLKVWSFPWGDSKVGKIEMIFTEFKV